MILSVCQDRPVKDRLNGTNGSNGIVIRLPVTIARVAEDLEVKAPGRCVYDQRVKSDESEVRIARDTDMGMALARHRGVGGSTAGSAWFWPCTRFGLYNVARASSNAGNCLGRTVAVEVIGENGVWFCASQRRRTGSLSCAEAITAAF